MTKKEKELCIKNALECMTLDQRLEALYLWIDLQQQWSNSSKPHPGS